MYFDYKYCPKCILTITLAPRRQRVGLETQISASWKVEEF